MPRDLRACISAVAALVRATPFAGALREALVNAMDTLDSGPASPNRLSDQDRMRPVIPGDADFSAAALVDTFAVAGARGRFAAAGLRGALAASAFGLAFVVRGVRFVGVLLPVLFLVVAMGGLPLES